MSAPSNPLPTKRALLIGCRADDLSGVDNDIRAVTLSLGVLGFDCQIVAGVEATRVGIITAFEELIARTQPGDCVCIYYSGHGGRALNENHRRYGGSGIWRGRKEPEVYYYLAPIDIRASPDGKFRGIFRAELSAWVAQLTNQTPNVTVVLDCCHAAGAVRDPKFRARAIAPPLREGVQAHIAWLRGQGYDLTTLCPEGNPDVVQLVASAATTSSYEYTNSKGDRGGLMTAMWLQVLAEQPLDGVTWSALGERVRELVQKQLPAQLPMVTGPGERVVFGLERRHRPGVLAYTQVSDQPILRGGSLHGVAVGDRYFVMPLEAGCGAREVAFAEAVVTEVRGQLSYVRLHPAEAFDEIPVGARAFLHQRESRRYCVAVTGSTALPTGLQSAIKNSPLLQVALEGASDPYARVHLEGKSCAVRGRDGFLVRHPFDVRETPGGEIVNAVEHVVRAEALRTFQTRVDGPRLPLVPTIRWGIVGGESCETIAAGCHIYVHTSNCGSEEVYISVLGIAVDATISLLSQSAPHGREVFGNKTYTLGEDSLGNLTGIPIEWSPLVPRDGPRRAALVVIVTDMPVDMRPLVTGIWPHAARCAKGPTEVFPAPVRVTRSSRSATRTRSARYAVRVFEFWVRP